MKKILFTGLIRDKKLFMQSIRESIELLNDNIIDEIILSTWTDEIDKYTGLRGFLKNNNVTIIETKPPIYCKGSILYQMKSMHVALDYINNTQYMVLKTRPDLYINKNNIKEILNKNLNIDNTLPKVFEKKVWVLYFEITKPFYIADEVIYASFNDMKQLINYDMIYDAYYNIDSGVSHIRRFIHPFLNKYPILEYYLKYLSINGLGCNCRFKVLEKFKSIDEYWNFMYLYYFIMYNYFYVGFEQKPNIKFYREWIDKIYDIHLPSDIQQAFYIEYSWNKEMGHIYAIDNKWTKNIINTLPQIKFNFDIDINKLQKVHIDILQTKTLYKNTTISLKYKIKQLLKKIIND